MHGMIKQRRASYRREFDIEKSWIPNSKDITESMLSYSKRMSEVNKTRGILTKDEQKIELPLLIRATHLPHPNRVTRSQEKQKRSNRVHQGGHGYRGRSLPNMKLEPLLGSKAKYKLSTASLVDLKSINGVKLKFLSSSNKFIAPLPAQHSIIDKIIVEPNGLNDGLVDAEHHSSSLSTPITVVVKTTDLKTEGQTTPTTTEKMTDNDTETKPTQLSIRSNVLSLGKKRKTKRIKFHKSHLEAIEEDDREAMLRFSRSNTYNKLPFPQAYYNPGATTVDVDFDNYQIMQHNLEERRRDVALLRKINSSTNSVKTASHMTMQSLAKRKLRKLPPLSIATAEDNE